MEKQRHATVAVIEDETDIANLVSLHLQKAGFDVLLYSSGADFMESTGDKPPDLVILDLMLPDIDGLEICKHLRRDSKFAGVKIIILTSKAEETDKIVGLELGADDYVTKPFSPRELVARARAVMRRSKEEAASPVLEVGGVLKIDTRKYEVFVNEKPVELTTTELKILKLLASKPGWVFSRNKILQSLWPDDNAVFDRTIDVHIKNLRDKLGSAGKMIKSIRGVGYKLQA